MITLAMSSDFLGLVLINLFNSDIKMFLDQTVYKPAKGKCLYTQIVLTPI